MKYHCPVELPTELWTQILTYLSNEEIVRLKGLNHTFWDAAMDVSYGTLDLTPFKEVPKWPIPARLLWLPQLRKKARRFRQPHAVDRVTTVHIVPNMEYTVWSRPYEFGLVNPKATCPFLFKLFFEILVFLCLWPFRWVVNNIIPWPIAFLKPTFWLSLSTSYELAWTLAELHNVHSLHVEEIFYSPTHSRGAKPNYHLKEPIPSSRPSLVLSALDSFALTLTHLKLTICDKGFDGFPCNFPALKSLEVILRSRNAYDFFPQLRSSLQSSLLLERLSLQTYRTIDPPIVSHPLPSHIHFSLLRVLELEVEPRYTVADRQSAQNVSELISQYKSQLEEVKIRFRGFIWSQASWDDPQMHVFSDSFCALPKLDMLRRLSIDFLDVRAWEPFGGGWFDRFMANLDRSSMDSLTHLSIVIAQAIYPHSHLALLPNLETFILKASNLSVKLLASIPTQMPNLRKFQIASQGRIVSASSLDTFIENGKLDKLQILSYELGQLLDKKAWVNPQLARIESAEIWLSPGHHATLRPVPTPYGPRGERKAAHMDVLVQSARITLQKGIP
ncbi:hypothetical protein DL96DRAFT_1674995 [Flagelloscypha sp. PMI_526]|nr:hypothetical protein DL96DRAFT_1674995 [Flagelloscypha sp. PMI_526]